ncbi:DUF6421 family protein (plasmid) [Streptomyces rapamycinicus]
MAVQGRFHRLRRRGAPTREAAAATVDRVIGAIEELARCFRDADYHRAVVADLRRWTEEGFGVPDFLDSLLAFQPARTRADGLQHLVVFPCTRRTAIRTATWKPWCCMVWPEWLAELEHPL